MPIYYQKNPVRADIFWWKNSLDEYMETTKKASLKKNIFIRITTDLSIETLQARREWQDILKVIKKITYSPDYCTQQGSHSNMKEKSKASQTSKS